MLAVFAGALTFASCRAPADTADPGASTEAATSGPLRGWHYTVTVPEDLARLEVRMCFAGPAPVALVPGAPESARSVDDVRTDSGHKLRRRDGSWSLTELGADACVHYTVDTTSLVEHEGGRKARRVDDSLLLRTSMWLLRPARLPSAAEVTAEFVLPPGTQLSLPWPQEGPRHVLDRTAFDWLGYTLIGDLHIDRLTHAGTDFTIARLDAPMRVSVDELRGWVIDAADSVALLYGGRFPRERMQVVVVPVESRGGSVYFGMAARGGGAAIYVMMDEAAAGNLRGGWTTVHEMLHHGMPFVDDAWMAEGWVSYYTELTRTWMGHRDEAEGWVALRDAFARGQSGGRLMTLEETSDGMHETYAYQRVYWGGAAIAFAIDIAMRKQTDGRSSLEDVMRELRSCCGDAEYMWRSEALLERLDTWYGRPLFTETAERHLRESDFPPVDAMFAELGVSFAGDQAILDETHPNAKHRRAIMAPRRSP